MTKSGKHCGKRRNCTFCAISSFITMFSKSCLLQRRANAFIWGKGLTQILILIVFLSFIVNLPRCVEGQVSCKLPDGSEECRNEAVGCGKFCFTLFQTQRYYDRSAADGLLTLSHLKTHFENIVTNENEQFLPLPQCFQLFQ